MERKRGRAVRRMLGLTLMFLAAGAGMTGTGFAGRALYAWMMTADTFAISEIAIQGNRLIDREEIVAMAGIDTGTNIFHPNLQAAAVRLKRDPRIRDVLVRRHLPNKIIIRLKERQPVAFINLDRLFGLDRDGVVIPLPAADRLPDLPLITGFGHDTPLSGRRVPESGGTRIDSVRVRRALYVLDALRVHAPALRRTISEVHVSRPDDPVLYTDKSMAVRLGVGRYPEKLARLRTTLDRLERDKVSTTSIDLRFDRQVIVRPVVTAWTADASQTH